MEERFQVGVITSTHGIKGEVKVFPTYFSIPATLRSFATVSVG